MRIRVMACLWAFCFAGGLVAGGDASVIEDASYPDNTAARAAWKPMGATAPVSVVKKDGARALKMPCNFKGTRIDRASWDKKVDLSLAFCLGVQFRFFCADVSPVSRFSFYLQSGEGWYTASFAPERIGAWCTVRIDKANTGIEGKPAGWGKIRTVRISAWRGGQTDTEFFLTDFRMVGRDAPIVVLRGDSVAQRNPDEAKSVSTFAQSVSHLLKEVHLPHLLVSDLDAVGDALKERKLIILPHNPSLPDAAARAIVDFVKDGGKIMVFYTLPGQLADVIGIQAGKWTRQKYPGFFAKIRFKAPLPVGMPREIPQQSWNIRDAKPAPDRGRIAAEWLDKDGKPTGHAALVRTDVGYLMTHVLLGDGATKKRQMLLAMACDLVPDLWKVAVDQSAMHLGRIGPFASFDEAQRGLTEMAKDKPKAKAALDKAAVCREKMRALTAAGKYPDAMAQAQETRERLIEAYCRAQSTEPGEQRGIWCHKPHGSAGMEWDEAIRVLAENGFNAVFPNMLWGGSADYESKVLPVSPLVREKGDPLVKCLAACKKYGVKCHVWKVNWNTGGRAPAAFLAMLKREGRSQLSFDGTSGDQWLCPSHPANRELECAAMVEVATKYEVDGIHFDYIRYPNRDGCFCAGCRQRFEKAMGRKVGDWPRDVRADKALESKWLDFRREQITALVKMVHEKARKARPEIRISAAVFPNWSVDRDAIGQDWKRWCERGYLDFVCPMDYTPYDSTFEILVRKQKAWAGSAHCYPGIGLTVWNPADDVVNLIGKIRITRRLGMRGFTVFDYTPSSSRGVVERCGMGITRKK